VTAAREAGRRSRAAFARRGAAAGALTALTLAAGTGCYQQRPVPGPTTPGTTLIVLLNDRGRAEVAPSVGPEVDRLEGRVLSTTDSTVTLAMRASRTFGGVETAWTGERVEFRRSGARAFEQRALSRRRTVLTVGAMIVGLVALIATRSLNVFGGPGTETNPPVPPQES